MSTVDIPPLVVMGLAGLFFLLGCLVTSTGYQMSHIDPKRCPCRLCEAWRRTNCGREEKKP